jgi:hypothetical protein
MRAGGTAPEEATLEEDEMCMADGDGHTPRGATAAAAPAPPAVVGRCGSLVRALVHVLLSDWKSPNLH